MHADPDCSSVMFTNHGAHCTCVVTSGWCNAQAQGGETTYVCVGIDLNHVQTQTLLYFNANRDEIFAAPATEEPS